MLSLALVIGRDASALDAVLPAFRGLAAPGRPVLVMDQGSGGAARDAVRRFTQAEGAAFLALDAPLSLPDAGALAREQTGADYVLAFGCDDRVSRPGLATLEQALKDARPDLAVMAPGWWLTHPDRPLPGPDTMRARADAYPDPRRLMVRGGQCDTPDPGLDPGAAWDVWDSVTGGAERILFHPDPVLLRRLPSHGAAAGLDAVAPLLAGTPRARRPAVLDLALLRVGDALALAPPEAAPATLAAAARLLRALPRALRRRACAAPAPAGPFLGAVRAGRDGGAFLAMLASARSDMQTRALAHEYAALRADLEAALPGPDYLRDLHARLRGT